MLDYNADSESVTERFPELCKVCMPFGLGWERTPSDRDQSLLYIDKLSKLQTGIIPRKFTFHFEEIF